MPFIKLTKVERKRFLVLILCLFCAIGAWLFMALNHKYVYNAKTVLIYKDFPQKKAFKALQTDTVDLQVEGTGWQLLFARLRINPQSIAISLEKLNNRNFILFTEQLSQINKQLETSQKIISVKPDTLYFDFSKRTNKRVPVKLKYNFSFEKQFGLASEIQLKPSYVNISGPQEELVKIKEWYTDTLKLTDLKGSVHTKIGVKTNNIVNVSIYPTTVDVKVPVDEFTEKTVEVPLNIINNHDFHNVQLYPKKVKVTFTVALSRYDEVDEDFIVANVDINEWRMLNHEQLTVSLSRFPEYCKLVSIKPRKINFIIEK
ncbi:CdaR family protein [Pedobacter insulae]|uniref:YbbR-like protein n=1 Tax=Pedobacter insulae TaxID=414048 RepID=A0A1I2UC68_9SPHI|nr:CdaR family protein [Pedobacter insulae]SFG74628.1 YbbR-like protein [Pedobacter insulae]